MEILQIENLTFRYPGENRDAVKNLTLSVESGAFTVICGQSGCGKTTLLKLLKRELAPAGEKSGRILYNGVLQESWDARAAASEIGFVLQNPDSQIVTDKVWHELAFGLENLGLPNPVIRRRVAEMASFFGIQNWFRAGVETLSGGQKQLLNLASVMVMQPKILLLDEPTSQLDPIAAADFIATLQKLNRELGLTILLVEHRLEEVLPIADKVLLMEDGGALFYDRPDRLGEALGKGNHPMALGLPSAVRIFQALSFPGPCPLTVRQGRDFLQAHFAPGPAAEDAPERESGEAEVMIELKNVWFRYEKDLPDVLRGADLAVRRGEFFCVLGGNGAGKTTLLQVIAGLNRAYRGKVCIGGKKIQSYSGNSLYRGVLALLPQNPQSVFLKDVLQADFEALLAALDVPKAERTAKIDAVAAKLGIAAFLPRHPLDLSGGEQQKCALAKMLLLRPQILLLDEPTKGLDAWSKHNLSQILKGLQGEGVTIVMVTHDVEFAAENATRCALFFDGELLGSQPPARFFRENNFYTTAANRMARSLWPDAVTCAQVVARCKMQEVGP